MKKILQDIDFNDKTVLLRADFNVPIKGGKITDDNRITQTIPTINYLIENGAKIVIFSHLGRVKTKEDLVKNDLAPVAEALSKKLDIKVQFCSKTRGKDLESKVAKLKKGQIVLVQNTRYEDLNEKAESKNSKELGKYWASLGDVLVNDAFGTAHRAHASNDGIAKNIKESCVGLLVQKELEMLNKGIYGAKKPIVAIIGGSKVSDKIGVIDNMLKKADKILIGGAMAYTFLKAQGHAIGKSMVEEDKIQLAKKYIEKAKGKIVLPVDHAMATEFKDVKPAFSKGIDIDANKMALDIGPKTIALYKKEISGAKTVIWNGPMGVFEMKNFKAGTVEVCKAIASLKDAFTLIGGGDSAAAAIQNGFEKSFSHISTGGGASLEFIEGKELVGISNIQEYVNPRRKVVIGNWKMYKDVNETKKYISSIEKQLQTMKSNEEVGVAVPFTNISEAKKLAKKVIVCAQNVHHEKAGAFTGEISFAMLKSLKVTHCLVGHSERRAYFGETDKQVNAKNILLIENSITPVFCVGETESQFTKKQTTKVITEQVTKGLANISKADASKVIVAYEPVWAIGTGKTATSEIAQNVIAGIRKTLAEIYDQETARKIRIIYGGSVNESNVKELLSQHDIDGALVGGASLDVKKFSKIFKR